jgi:hypothetical protein
MLDENKAINTKCSWEMKKNRKFGNFFKFYIYIFIRKVLRERRRGEHFLQCFTRFDF